MREPAAILPDAVRLLEDTFPSVVCPETVAYPLAVKFVEETLARLDWPAVVREPNVPFPEVLIVVPVAFVNVSR